MLPLICTIALALVSALIMRLDRDPVRISKAIWIPLTWLTIASSRPVSNWVHLGSPVEVSNQYIEGSPLDRNVLTTLVVLAAYVLYQRRRLVVPILRANAPLLAFFGFCGLSMLWADYPFVLFKRWIRALADAGMVLIILTEAHPPEALKRVLTCMGCLLIPLSILFTRFFPALGRSYTYSGIPMWTGVATDKNALGALCMVVGVVLLSRWLTLHAGRDRNRRRRLIIVGTLFAMVLYLMAMIDSKTAQACFLMASALIMLRRFPTLFRKPAILTAAMLAMISLAYSVLFLHVGSSALSEMGRDTSLTGRTQVWDIVIPFAENPLIGAGFENFWIGKRLETVSRAVGEPLNQAHNGYIEVYLNIGWVGLALLGSVIVGGYRTVLKNLLVNPEMSGLKLAFFFICLVYNFTEAAFKILSPVWITFLWATMAVPRLRTLSAPAPADMNAHETPVSSREGYWGEYAQQSTS